MTPDAFADRLPILYRLSVEGSSVGIRRHGLLTARTLAQRAGHDLKNTRRPKAIALTLNCGTPVQITDNAPLSEKRLAGVLDDSLTPTDWLAMLNARVFFWPSQKHGRGNLKARHRHGYCSEWHMFDTRRLLTAVWDRAEITPFNSGATVHIPPRRGLATFALLAGLDYGEWRKRRVRAGNIKSPDTVAEVTVHGDLEDAASALIDVIPA